ncbi:MAG: hypothetical protein D6714_04560 [Bacteroidetes bacterium]|nr:MAG: hypothetical protein D6714_04560 [Bacteroidota bacterium]
MIISFHTLEAFAPHFHFFEYIRHLIPRLSKIKTTPSHARAGLRQGKNKDTPPSFPFIRAPSYRLVFAFLPVKSNRL